ncbi:hypothetical protein EUGRSUZ_F01193 [Eucalyptus grandis]|uniref:Uncharacterized protein n=1 Tax=Eucalyptus grandis TaxID=71139 RepID=A0ACC3KED6_EUCGR|nr:hypothetical protein EUGRSUZ_F01193 [Eucalyptus grandis]
MYLIVVYEYKIYTAVTYLSNGSALLLRILGPGIISNLFSPMLGALPNAILILVSGLSGSTETAQSQVSVGMGLLAGSTVMLLTVIWGSCIIVGKCDLHNSVAMDKQDTKGFSLKSSGVSTDLWAKYAARIMVFSVIPFIIVQLPQILNSTSGRHLAVLISLIVSLILLIAYCIYQVATNCIIHIRTHPLGRLLTDDGELNKDIAEKLFTTLDENGDGYLNAAELKALVVGIQFEEIDLNEQTTQEHARLKSGDQTDEVTEGVGNRKLTTLKAVLLLVLGTIIAGVFADPLVDAVDNFSDATGIPTFFISFIALPLATNSSEAVSAIIFASRKKQRTASLTFSELYGAVTMNNLLCLSVFLAIVYIKGLTWDFSSEVLVILIVCFVMGTFASFRTTFPLWTFSLALLLYPFSLALVYILDYIFGWS